MPPRIRIFQTGKLICETEGSPGETIYQRIAASDININAPCGGKGRCGKCLVSLSPDGEKIQACRTKIDGDMDVYLPDETEMEIADTGTAPSATPGAAPGADTTATPEQRAASEVTRASRLGAAIDIGTTTVVVHLTNLVTGKRLATASGANAQRKYGADVISRIQYCVENGHETLTQLIRQQLSDLIRHTCTVSGERPRDIGYVSIAANTIMEHLAAGYSPVGMGIAPFTPVDLFGKELPAWDGLNTAKTAKIYFSPAVASYVGGDITAGILAAKLEDTQGPAIFLDIGTNGEIVMKHGDTYYCCSTAAGPAFEGAEITMGMAAVSGAINHVKWDGELRLSVIGDKKACGICGSGLLDSLAIMIRNGVVDETGRLLNADEIDNNLAQHIGKVDGKNVFWLTTGQDSQDGQDGVYMSVRDIRKLQLAKSAIAAGIHTLLHYAGITEEQVESFILAGGFGSFMNQYSAARIGIFPKSFLDKTQTLGNTAGEGATLALCSGSARARLADIRERCRIIELSGDAVFREQFVEQMMFDVF